MNKPKKIWIHCAATPDRFPGFTAFDVDKWHKERGWKGCGYHCYITRSGQIQLAHNSPCRPTDVVGAHVYAHNRDSLGLCMDGTKDFTDLQVRSLVWQIILWLKKFNISTNDIHAHSEVADKDCPNIPIEVIRQLVRVTLALEQVTATIADPMLGDKAKKIFAPI